MTYKVVILHSAQTEIRNLYKDYLVPNFGQEVARRQYEAIKRSVLLLQFNPRLGRPVPELSETGFDHYRQMVVEDLNKVIYQVDDDKKVVYVHIFCSTRQDFETILRQRLLGERG